MKKLVKYFLFFSLMMLPICSFSQDSKKEREIQKMKEYRERQSFKAYKKAVKRQWKIQDPATRKRMRKDLKKAKMYNYHRKPFFLKRWFTKKGFKKKPHDDTTDPSKK